MKKRSKILDKEGRSKSRSNSNLLTDPPKKVASFNNSIKIYARLKPPTDASLCQYQIDKHIKRDGSTSDIFILNSGIRPDEDNLNNNQEPGNRIFSYKFRFSRVFDIACSQEELFEEICQPVLDRSLQGYNSTIFAYGQTGSGKTYTMSGHKKWKKRGIIPRSLIYIFEKMDELNEEGNIASAFISYLEIYNENGYDLLRANFSKKKLEDIEKVQLFEDNQQQFHVKNLSVHPVKSVEESMQLVYLGDQNRQIAETPMNEASSRSHCIFTIYLNIREGDSSMVRRSKIHLVDLAGSERLSNSISSGQMFSEACNINLALHFLEQVIVALGESNRSHIPYRNSMMTSILKDSLGGNCMTSMVATLSLEHRNILETLQTCRFAQRVALVTNIAILNEEKDPMLLIAQLRQENKRLKEIIAGAQGIKGMDLNSAPLVQEEVEECVKLVDAFLQETDEQAILPVDPDMRMIQTCFRCLKVAVQMEKEEADGKSRNSSAISNFQLKSKDFPYDGYMTRHGFLECLHARDEDIDTLSKLLNPLKVSKAVTSAKSTPITLERTRSVKFEAQADVDSVPYLSGEHGLSREGSTTQFNLSEFKKLLTKDSFVDDKQSVIRLSPASTSDSDPSPALTDGFSESKKSALESYMQSYKGLGKLQDIQENLAWKRREVKHRETLLRRNQANLRNIKMDMLSSKDAGREVDPFMKETVDSQTIALEDQERKLLKSREDMNKVEEKLRGLCGELMYDFEKHWHSIANFKMKAGMGFNETIRQHNRTDYLKQREEDHYKTDERTTRTSSKSSERVKKQRAFQFVPFDG